VYLPNDSHTRVQLEVNPTATVNDTIVQILEANARGGSPVPRTTPRMVDNGGQEKKPKVITFNKAKAEKASGVFEFTKEEVPKKEEAAKPAGVLSELFRPSEEEPEGGDGFRMDSKHPEKYVCTQPQPQPQP
jgi:hypothetical protein